MEDEPNNSAARTAFLVMWARQCLSVDTAVIDGAGVFAGADGVALTLCWKLILERIPTVAECR